VAIYMTVIENFILYTAKEINKNEQLHKIKKRMTAPMLK